MNAFDPGDLNRRILIQLPSGAQDDVGQQLGEWVTFRECWASITPASSKEVYIASGGNTSQVTHKIVIRYVFGVTSAMRIQYNGRMFAVQTVSDPGEQHMWLQLMCLERDEGSR